MFCPSSLGPRVITLFITGAKRAVCSQPKELLYINRMCLTDCCLLIRDWEIGFEVCFFYKLRACILTGIVFSVGVWSKCPVG